MLIIAKKMAAVEGDTMFFSKFSPTSQFANTCLPIKDAENNALDRENEKPWTICSLSVLKLLPGTYLNQIENPLRPKIKKWVKNKNFRAQTHHQERRKFFITQNSTLHKHKAQCKDACIAQLYGLYFFYQLHHLDASKQHHFLVRFSLGTLCQALGYEIFQKDSF